MEEIEITTENYQPFESHGQTWSHNTVHLAMGGIQTDNDIAEVLLRLALSTNKSINLTTYVVICIDCVVSFKFNDYDHD